MSNGCIDIECFLGDTTALNWGCGLECAHVVKAVCKLNQNDSHVVGHREQHFAEVLGLRLLPVLKT